MAPGTNCSPSHALAWRACTTLLATLGYILMTSGRRISVIGVGLGVTVGRGVAAGVASGCGLGVHPASRPAAAILQKSRLEITRERGPSLWLLSFVISLSGRPVNRIKNHSAGSVRACCNSLKSRWAWGRARIRVPVQASLARGNTHWPYSEKMVVGGVYRGAMPSSRLWCSSDSNV
jgi:hypothetical protein